MRIALVVAMMMLFICGVGICVESKPASIRAEKQKPEINKTYSTARQDKKSETAIITGQPTANNSRNETNTQPPEDKNFIVNQKIAKYTGFLALLAFLQFITMAIQAGFLSKTLGATKEAADAAKKSADVAEKALTLVERPYVFAHSISKFHMSKEINPAITYEVANFGKTPAIIQSAHVALENIESNLSAVLEVDRRHTLVSVPVLSAGEVRQKIEEEIPANMVNFITTEKGFTPDLKHGEDLFFRVIIRYRGPFTEGHESGFCWRYNTHTNYFEPYGHEDYNYTK